jgi:hypothetical protein
VDLADHIEHVHGPEEVAYAEDELVVVCLLRDGRPYIKSFVDHYLSLGAKHLFFLDNGSTDGTVEALRGHESVTVLRSELPFKEYQFEMKRYLTRRFGRDRWSLCVDIDEFFDYPYSDVLGLDSFLRYLSERSFTAVVAQMLELFSEKPLQDTAATIGGDVPVKELYRFYDVSDVRSDNWRLEVARGTNNTLTNEEVTSLSGGIKSTIFGRNATLTKHPLIFSDGMVKPVDGTAHRVSNARIADITCVLYHYRFLDNFYEHIRRAVRQENYMKDSVKQKQYLQVLKQNPTLQLKQDTAIELESVNELVGNGFLVVSREYMATVNEEDQKKGGGPEARVQRLTDALFATSAELSALRQETEQVRQQAERVRRRANVLQTKHEKGLEKRKKDLEVRKKDLEGKKKLADRNRHLEARVQVLEGEIRAIHSSRSWRLLSVLSRAKSVLSGSRK